jgi:hypothetical protein
MKTTKPESQECSVTVAIAELGRLERERAELAAAKQSARETLARQAHELVTLRERFEAERPRAIARVRRERVRREWLREQLTARLIAEAESAHDERLVLVRAELEAKRLRLAALEASSSVPRPSRRWLEWSIPVAATAMVAFLGFTLFDEEQAVAQPAQVEQIERSASEAAEPVSEEALEPVVEPKAEPEPEVVEPAPEPKAEPSKKPATKSKKTSDKKSEEKPKTETKPVVKKNSKPLELGDFNGDPLG